MPTIIETRIVGLSVRLSVRPSVCIIYETLKVFGFLPLRNATANKTGEKNKICILIIKNNTKQQRLIERNVQNFKPRLSKRHVMVSQLVGHQPATRVEVAGSQHRLHSRQGGRQTDKLQETDKFSCTHRVCRYLWGRVGSSNGALHSFAALQKKGL